MLHNRNTQQQPQPGNMVVSDSGMGVHVMGEQLREVDAPIEGLVGAGRGAVNGAVLGVAASLARTYAATASTKDVFDKKLAINNITSTHVGMIMGITAAFAALSGFIRYSRAAKHNEWSQKHYDFLNAKAASADTPKGFAEREDARKNEPENRQVGA